MITGLHALVYTEDADATRAFFRDVLKLPSVDVGHGWLIFASPPAEIAAHPAESAGETGRHELYLMCDDVEKTVAELQTMGIDVTEPITEQNWRFATRLKLPGGVEFGLYQPKHPSPPPIGR